MSSSVKTILFAVILCFVISIMLTAASTGLQKYQQKNILLDKQKNILKSVGLVKEDRKYSSTAIEIMYKDNIQAVWVEPTGAIVKAPKHGEEDLPIYLYTKDDNVQAYIVPINSRGLWGRILGYLAIQNDGSTVSGFTVYKHSETPGLGGEIEQKWFQKNFVGKRIVDEAGDFVSVSIAKGKVADKIPEKSRGNYVDGISGATLTGKYLSAGMKEILLNYEPVSIRFRKHTVTQEKK